MVVRGRFVVSDLLRDLEFTAVLQIGRDAAGTEGMIANARFNAGRFRPPADDTVGVLLEEGVGGQLASLAAGGAEEIAVCVIGDAGCFDVIVQTLIEAMMAGNVVLLTALGAELENGSSNPSESSLRPLKLTTAPIRCRCTTDEVLDALGRYTKDSKESDR